MEKLNQILQMIFYLVWIFLGVVVIFGVIFLIAANPFRQMNDVMSRTPQNQGGLRQFGPPPEQGQPGDFGQTNKEPDFRVQDQRSKDIQNPPANQQELPE